MTKTPNKNRFNTFVGLALLISLIMNFILFTKVDQIQNDLNNVTQNQQHMTSILDSQTSDVQHTLNRFIDEQSWISMITMTPDSKGGDVKEATFEWQVKELHNESEVVFNYAYGTSEEFIKIPVDGAEQGLFQVNVPLEVDIEPQWEVTTITNSGDAVHDSKSQAEAAYQQDTIRYFVSVTHEDMVRSSEVQSEYLGYFGSNVYGVLQTDLHLHDDTMSITIMNHGVFESSNELREMYLLKYEDEKLMGEDEINHDKEMSPHEEDLRIFQLNNIDQYENMRLVLKAVYSNGETFQNEIYK